MNMRDEIPEEATSELLKFEVAIEKLRFNCLDLLFRKGYDIDENGFDSVEKIGKWEIDLMEDKLKYQDFQRDLSKLARALKLNKENLKRYLVFGVKTFSTGKLVLKWEWNSNSRQKELWLRIAGTTRRDDISKNWKKIILPYQKKLSDYKSYARIKGKKLSRSNFYIKKLAYAYKMKKCSYGSIWKKLKRLGVILEPSNVGNLIADYEREMRLDIMI